MILAVIARHTVTGTLEGARQGYRVARSELGQAVPAHAVDTALGAYRDEGRRLAAAVKGSRQWSVHCAASPSYHPALRHREQRTG